MPFIAIYGYWFNYHYPDMKIGGTSLSGGNFTPLETALFAVIGRLGIVAVDALIVIMGVTQTGGFILRFLTLPFWEVLGKLTYTA